MLDEPNQRGMLLHLFFLVHLQKLIPIVLALEILGESIAHLPLDVDKDVAHYGILQQHEFVVFAHYATQQTVAQILEDLLVGYAVTLHLTQHPEEVYQKLSGSLLAQLVESFRSVCEFGKDVEVRGTLWGDFDLIFFDSC